jgi:hypothetical protein
MVPARFQKNQSKRNFWSKRPIGALLIWGDCPSTRDKLHFKDDGSGLHSALSRTTEFPGLPSERGLMRVEVGRGVPFRSGIMGGKQLRDFSMTRASPGTPNRCPKTHLDVLVRDVGVQVGDDQLRGASLGLALALGRPELVMGPRVDRHGVRLGASAGLGDHFGLDPHAPSFLPGVPPLPFTGLAFFLPPPPTPLGPFLGADLIIASRDWSRSMVHAWWRVTRGRQFIHVFFKRVRFDRSRGSNELSLILFGA